MSYTRGIKQNGNLKKQKHQLHYLQSTSGKIPLGHTPGGLEVHEVLRCEHVLHQMTMKK